MLLSSTGPLSFPLVLYYFLLSLHIPMVFFYLFALYLFLWYFTSFYLPTAYINGTLLYSSCPLPITILLFFILLAQCLYLWYSTIYLHSAYLLLFFILLFHCLYIWYSIVFYWLPAYPYDSLLPSTGSLSIPIVPYYLLLPPCLSLWFFYNHLLTHCLYLWYYSTFIWFLQISNTIPPSTSSLSIPMVLYPYGTNHLLTHCLYLWY